METQNKLMQIASDWTPTKQAIEEMAQRFLLPLNKGDVNPEQMAIIIDALKKTIERIEKEARPVIAHNLHSRYSRREEITVRGCGIELIEAGVKYDYSDCGDGVLNDLNEQVEKLNLQIKAREEMLRAIPYGKTEFVVNQFTGEMMELKAPKRSSTETYKVKFPESNQ